MIRYPDYQHSILNLACSVLQYYNLPHHHPVLPELQPYFQKRRKNLVCILFDGMGTKNIEQFLEPDSFLRTHFLNSLTSVFPACTTAATTTMKTGLSPAEHGWLGLNQYIPQIDEIAGLYSNSIIRQGKKIPADFPIPETYMPYSSIVDQVNQSGHAKAWFVSYFGNYPIQTADEMFQGVESFCRQDGEKYIYAYWHYPDFLMHQIGSDAKEVGEMIRDFNRKLAKLSDTLSDTLLLITADHGHVNVEYQNLYEDVHLLNMLNKDPSLEARATAFFVKDEYQTNFPIYFEEKYGKDFLLFSKQEFLDSQLFGPGKPHSIFLKSTGDFISVSKSSKTFALFNNSKIEISHHSGMTEDEMLIPLIIKDHAP